MRSPEKLEQELGFQDGPGLVNVRQLMHKYFQGGSRNLEHRN